MHARIKEAATGEGIMLLPHAHPRAGDCLWFRIRIQDVIEAVHRCMHRVHLEECL